MPNPIIQTLQILRWTTKDVNMLFAVQGSLGQILFWTGLFEIVAGWPAMNASIEGTRIPGDYGFDPLGVGKKDFARMQVGRRKTFAL